MPLNPISHPLVSLSTAEAAMLAKVRALVAEHIGPRAEAVGQTDEFAWDNFRLLAREGIVATAFPREYGGSNASMLLRVRIIEELAGACTTSASIITGTDLSSRPIVAGALPKIQQAVMPDLVTGVRQSAFALTEPGAGSDVARLATDYVVQADGSYLLNGRKKFITRANVADMFVAVARLKDGPEGARGLSAFLVPRAAKGIQISPIIPLA